MQLFLFPLKLDWLNILNLFLSFERRSDYIFTDLNLSLQDEVVYESFALLLSLLLLLIFIFRLLQFWLKLSLAANLS